MSKLLNLTILNSLIISMILLFSIQAYATHQRAGEITYRHISGLTYEVTITTYTFSPSAADRCELTINWGDGQSSVLLRTNGPSGVTPAGIFCEHTGENISSEIRLSIYKGVHTYSAPSTYILWLEDPNRNLGIQNIPNSVDVPLYIETLLVINPFLGSNNSPVLLIPPIDNGCVGLPFLHNPGAFDPDGDSLSFRLVNCKGAGGRDIPGYKLPNEVDLTNPGTFEINELTGDVLWDSPVQQGEYNFAFVIEEWRNGIRIGYVTRDMQVNIIACNNTPPEIFVASDTCIIAGDTLRLQVRAIDVDNHKITLTATGGPLQLPVSPAIYNQPGDSVGQVSATLIWPTVCAHVRKQPYQIFFKALDNGTPVRLFDLKTTNITVIAPPVVNPIVTPLGNTMLLNWNQHPCNEADGYRIYRRAGNSGFTPNVCQTGVPPESGYQLIAQTNGIAATSLIDDNNGVGLVRGITYCYLITAWFDDGSESIASEEFCANLKKDMPVFTNVNVLNTSTTAGSIEIIWSKPTELDPVQTPGPFIYKLFRSQGFNNAVKENIAEFNNLNDTLFIDNGLNTKDTAWTYTIEFINNTPGNIFTIGFTPPASSVFIRTIPSDKQIGIQIISNVPWSNVGYTIYRQNESGVFDSIAFVTSTSYIDRDLVNEIEYCYLVRAKGTYGTAGYKDPLLNYSQEKCDSPRDNVPPCATNLWVEVECELNSLIFTWDDLSLGCAPDIARYELYRAGNPHQLIESFDAGKLSFTFLPPSSITGCFFVIGIDVNGNSDTTNYRKVCTSIDDCPRYRLPNVFTPNNDGYNDYFIPFPGYTSVDRIDLKIINRWGVVVFETNDPAIRWDGRDQNTNKPCSDGVYFYVCEVYEIVGNPETEDDKILEQRTLTDSLHILR
ncbi:MAG: gliding motility-associated C-terminal domain-containing protein [Lentimicrobium sp.]|nr:gliding motility-associated C-terminal domain-containing protein [Lentimicrobium sp.]